MLVVECFKIKFFGWGGLGFAGGVGLWGRTTARNIVFPLEGTRLKNYLRALIILITISALFSLPTSASCWGQNDKGEVALVRTLKIEVILRVLT